MEGGEAGTDLQSGGHAPNEPGPGPLSWLHSGPDKVSPFPILMTSMLGIDDISQSFVVPKITVASESLPALQRGEPVRLWANGKCFGLLSEYAPTVDKDSRAFCTGRVELINKDVYVGDLSMNWLPNGMGEIHYADKRIVSNYRGTFSHGLCSGLGILTFQNGVVYTGEFLKNAMSGLGGMKFPEGIKYTGWFLDGNRHGHGRQIETGDSRYTGLWKDDKREGFGTLDHVDGSVYAGYWVDDDRCGHGWNRQSDGSIYIGAWKENMMWGKGTMYYHDGSVFEGEWLRSNHFKGVMTTKEIPGFFSEIYIGSFDEDGERHGKGTLKKSCSVKYKSRDIYKGDFHHGNIHGHGVWQFREGHTYCGQFVNELFEGEGVFRNDEVGWEFSGTFSKDRPVNGILMLSNGQTYKVRYSSTCDYIYRNPIPQVRMKMIYKKDRQSNSPGQRDTGNDLDSMDIVLERERNANDLIRQEEEEKKKKMTGLSKSGRNKLKRSRTAIDSVLADKTNRGSDIETKEGGSESTVTDLSNQERQILPFGEDFQTNVGEAPCSSNENAEVYADVNKMPPKHTPQKPTVIAPVKTISSGNESHVDVVKKMLSKHTPAAVSSQKPTVIAPVKTISSGNESLLDVVNKMPPKNTPQKPTVKTISGGNESLLDVVNKMPPKHTPFCNNYESNYSKSVQGSKDIWQSTTNQKLCSTTRDKLTQRDNTKTVNSPTSVDGKSDYDKYESYVKVFDNDMHSDDSYMTATLIKIPPLSTSLNLQRSQGGRDIVYSWIKCAHFDSLVLHPYHFQVASNEFDGCTSVLKDLVHNKGRNYDIFCMPVDASCYVVDAGFTMHIHVPAM